MDYAQAIKDRLAKDPKADVSDLQKARADKIAGKGAEGQAYVKQYSQAERDKHASTPIQSRPTIPGQKPVQISSNKYPNGRTLNSLDDAETDAERSIFLGAQGLIQNDTNQYAYVDEYGFEHVGSLGNALAYGRPDSVQKYEGAASGGYARDANGNRAMIGLNGSRNYGNAPLDKQGNPLRYDAAGAVSGPQYNLDSYLSNFKTVEPVVNIPPSVAQVIAAKTAPATTKTNKPAVVKPIVNPMTEARTEQNLMRHPVARMEPKSGPSYGPTMPQAGHPFNSFSIPELKIIARGTGTASLYAQKMLREMKEIW